jgi:hypothetical protein
MKYILILILVGSVGACAIAPTGFGDRDRGYNRGDGNYRDLNYNDANYHKYGSGGHSDDGDSCRNEVKLTMSPLTSSSPTQGPRYSERRA